MPKKSILPLCRNVLVVKAIFCVKNFAQSEKEFGKCENSKMEKNYTIQRLETFQEKCFAMTLQFLHTKTVFWEVGLLEK